MTGDSITAYINSLLHENGQPYVHTIPVRCHCGQTWDQIIPTTNES